jgi:MHS family proline/betaine transporter-like MFS transporter
MAISKKSFFGAALGTLIEYYDYALFTMLLPIISPVFFPSLTSYQALIKGYFILLISTLARPLGGLLFGYIGDVFGRRCALLGSMYGIAAATFVIGVTPSFEAIGIAAVVIVTLAKSVQNFCFGGEYNGAGVYVVEHAKNQQEALTGSLLSAMTLSGALLASLAGAIITLPVMPAWSWRIAFIFGSLIAVFAIFYRKNLLESPHFQQADLKQHSLRNLLKQHPREMAAGIFIGGFATVPFVTVVTFVTPVLMTKGYFTSHQLMLIQIIFNIIAIATLIFAGKLADIKSPAKVMRWSTIALMLLPYPLLLTVDHGLLILMLPALAAVIIINEMCLGPSNAYLKNLFPMQYRYRGCSLSFGIGMSLFGGFTPLVENCIYQFTGQFSAIALWLMFIGAGTYLTMKRQAASKTSNTCADLSSREIFCKKIESIR